MKDRTCICMDDEPFQCFLNRYPENQFAAPSWGTEPPEQEACQCGCHAAFYNEYEEDEI